MRTQEVTACDALYAAGHYMMERSRVEDAAVLFRTMLLADAADERGWLALGACHESLEQPKMAEEVYAAGAQLARNKVRCLLATARVLAQHDDELAMAALERAERFAHTDEERALVEQEVFRRTS